MALFTRKETKAQISPAEPAVRAAVGGYNPNAAGVSLIGQYYTYQEGEARNRAMTVPAISRARDLHANVISAMPLQMYRERWNDTEREMEDEYIAPRSWLRVPICVWHRPAPARPRPPQPAPLPCSTPRRATTPTRSRSCPTTSAPATPKNAAVETPSCAEPSSQPIRVECARGCPCPESRRS